MPIYDPSPTPAPAAGNAGFGSGGFNPAPSTPSDTSAGKTSVNLFDPAATISSLADIGGGITKGIAGAIGGILGVGNSADNQGVLGAIGGIGVPGGPNIGGAVAAGAGALQATSNFMDTTVAQSRLKVATGAANLPDNIINDLAGLVQPVGNALMLGAGAGAMGVPNAIKAAYDSAKAAGTPITDVGALFGQAFKEQTSTDNPIPQAILDQVQSGQLSIEQAAQQMNNQNIAITNNPIYNMGATQLIDPMTWLTLGVGEAAKASTLVRNLSLLANLGDETHDASMSAQVLREANTPLAAAIGKAMSAGRDLAHPAVQAVIDGYMTKMAEGIKTVDDLSAVTKLSAQVYDATIGGMRAAAHAGLSRISANVTDGFLQHVGVDTFLKADKAFKDVFPDAVSDAVGTGVAQMGPQVLGERLGDDVRVAAKAGNDAAMANLYESGQRLVQDLPNKVTQWRSMSDKAAQAAVRKLAERVTPFVPLEKAKQTVIDAWSKVTGLDAEEVEKRLTGAGIKYTQKDAKLALMAQHGAAIVDLRNALRPATEAAAKLLKRGGFDPERTIVVSERTLTRQNKAELLDAIARGDKTVIQQMMDGKDILSSHFGAKMPTDAELRTFLRGLKDSYLVDAPFQGLTKVEDLMTPAFKTDLLATLNSHNRAAIKGGIEKALADSAQLRREFGSRVSPKELKTYLSGLKDEDLQSAIDVATRRAANSKLPPTIKAWLDKWGDTKTLGFSPKESWKTFEDETGEFHLINPFTPLVDADPHGLNYKNGIGRMADSLVGSVTNHTIASTAKYKMMQQMWEASKKLPEDVRGALGPEAGQRYYQALQRASADYNLPVRGLGGLHPGFYDEIFEKATDKATLSAFKAAGGDTQYAMLKAFAGDWSEIGLTQAFTGRVKQAVTFMANALDPGHPHLNPVTLVADFIYPKFRFTASPIFHLQQLAETGFFRALRGTHTAPYDKDTADLLKGIIHADLGGSLVAEEYAPILTAGHLGVDEMLDANQGLMRRMFGKWTNTRAIKDDKMFDQTIQNAAPQWGDWMRTNMPRQWAQMGRAAGTTDPAVLLGALVRSRAGYDDAVGAAAMAAEMDEVGKVEAVVSHQPRAVGRSPLPPGELEVAMKQNAANFARGLDSNGDPLPADIAKAGMPETPRELRGRLVSPSEHAALSEHGQQMVAGHMSQPAEDLMAYEKDPAGVTHELYTRTMGEDYGGATYDPHRGGYRGAPQTTLGKEPTSGPFSSAHPMSRTMEVPQARMQTEAQFSTALKKFIKQNKDVLSKPGAHIGTFNDVERGTVDFDVALVTDTKEGAEALQIARGPGAQGAYDFGTGNGVFAPRIALTPAEQMRAAGYSEDISDVAAAVIDARAKAWAAENQLPVEQFVPMHFAEIRKVLEGESPNMTLGDRVSLLQSAKAKQQLPNAVIQSLWSGPAPDTFKMLPGADTHLLMTNADDWKTPPGFDHVINVPGGLNHLDEGTWTPYDLVKLKFQNIDANALDSATSTAMHQKLFRGYSAGGRHYDPVDTARRMVWASLTPHTGLNQTEALTALLGPVGATDEEFWANAKALTAHVHSMDESPTVIGDRIKAAYGIKTKKLGGAPGLAGQSNTLGNMAKNLKRAVDDPSFFTRNVGETDVQYIERLAATADNFQFKVAALHAELGDPEHFTVPAIDNQMLNILSRTGHLTPEDTIKLYAADTLTKEQAAERVAAGDEVKGWASPNGRKVPIYVGRGANKTINPDLPEHLQQLVLDGKVKPSALKANKLQVMEGSDYERVAGELDKMRLEEQSPLSLSGYQWHLYDLEHREFSPHIGAAPDFRYIDKQTAEDLSNGLHAASEAGMGAGGQTGARVSNAAFYQKAQKVIKGSTTFQEDGRAVIRFFQAADPTTAFHEIAHVFRRTLPSNLMKIAEDHYGVVGGNWLVKHEEAFAKDFEHYMATGLAPKPELQAIFDKAKQWLVDLYHNLSGKDAVSPEMKQVFDDMLTTPEDRITAAYAKGDIEAGQQLNKEAGIARGGTVESGGAIKAAPSAYAQAHPEEAAKYAADQAEYARLHYGTQALNQEAEPTTLAEDLWEARRRNAMENGDPEPPKPASLIAKQAEQNREIEAPKSPWVRNAQEGALPPKTLYQIHDLAQTEPQAEVAKAMNGIGMTAADTDTVFEAARYYLLENAKGSWKTHYLDPGRSFLNRTLNHPYLGLYPLSYMWGKVVPEFARFLLVRPFGLDAPLLGLMAATRVQHALAGAIANDPGLSKWMAENADLTYLVRLFLPADPTDIPVNAPAYVRHLAVGQSPTSVAGNFIGDTASNIGLGRDITQLVGSGGKVPGTNAPTGALPEIGNDIQNFANSLLKQLDQSAHNVDVQNGIAPPAPAPKLPPGLFGP